MIFSGFWVCGVFLSWIGKKLSTKFLFCFVGQTNAQISRITEELSEKSEELVRYQEEISSLLSQIVDLQHKLKEVRECWWRVYAHVCMGGCACQCFTASKNWLASQGLYTAEEWLFKESVAENELSPGNLMRKLWTSFLCFQHVIEKEELKLHLQASKDAQRQLTAEVFKASISIDLDKRLK